MGFEDEARVYRDRYVESLKNMLDRIVEYTADDESRIFKNESHVIDGVITVIHGEEEGLIEIMQGLKF